MALGTATAGGRFGHDGRPIFHDLVSFPGDGAYPTGGTAAFEAYVRSAVGRGSLDIIAVLGQSSGGYTAVYDRTADKLKVFRTGSVNAVDEEVPNATNLAAVTFNVLVISV